MYYYYDPQLKKLIVKKTELVKVPEFARLFDAYGLNALQYMIFFLGAGGPFFRTYDDTEQRHNKVLEAIKHAAWDEGGKRLPARLYEDPVFKMAGGVFTADHDDQIELQREAVMHKIQRRMVKELNELLEKPKLDEADNLKIDALTDRLAKQAKYYEQVKVLAKDRIATDDEPVIIFGDIGTT